MGRHAAKSVSERMKMNISVAQKLYNRLVHIQKYRYTDCKGNGIKSLIAVNYARFGDKNC